MKLIKFVNAHRINMSLNNIPFKRGVNSINLEDAINESKNVKDLIKWLNKNTNGYWTIDDQHNDRVMYRDSMGNFMYLFIDQEIKPIKDIDYGKIYDAFVAVIDSLTTSEIKRKQAKKKAQDILNSY